MGVNYSLAQVRVDEDEESFEVVRRFLLDTPGPVRYAEHVKGAKGSPRGRCWSWLIGPDEEEPTAEDCDDPEQVLRALRWLKEFSATDHSRNREFWDEMEATTHRADGKRVAYAPAVLAKRFELELAGMIAICESAEAAGDQVLLMVSL